MATLLNQDAENLPNPPGSPQWGLYDSNSGSQIIQADCVVSLEFGKEFPTSDYPVEPNSFETYNKVQLPFDVTLRYAAGGDVSNRQQLFSDANTIAPQATTYSLIMPEWTWPSVTVNGMRFIRRADAGNGLFILDLQIKEVMQTAEQAFTNTSNPGSQNAQGGGNVQSQQLNQQENVAVTGNYQNFVQNNQQGFNGGGGW